MLLFITFMIFLHCATHHSIWRKYKTSFHTKELPPSPRHKPCRRGNKDLQIFLPITLYSDLSASWKEIENKIMHIHFMTNVVKPQNNSVITNTQRVEEVSCAHQNSVSLSYVPETPYHKHFCLRSHVIYNFASLFINNR